MGRLFYYPLFLVLMLVSIGYATADLADNLICSPHVRQR